jgi:hypothetical protein
MESERRWLGGLRAAGAFSGCTMQVPAGDRNAESLGRISLAMDVCSETVPSSNYVDGIPAYAQCPASQNSAIFSDNGVDTATSSQGSGWTRTQWIRAPCGRGTARASSCSRLRKRRFVGGPFGP